MIIQKNNVVLFSNFQTKSFKIWCKNTGNKTVNLNTKKLRQKLETAKNHYMLENDDKQGSGNNDNNSSSSQNQETHRDGSVTVVKTEN